MPARNDASAKNVTGAAAAPIRRAADNEENVRNLHQRDATIEIYFSKTGLLIEIDFISY